MRSLLKLSMLALLLAPAACVDILIDGRSSGTYQLTSANGLRVPAVVYSESGNGLYSLKLIGGELRLRGDDSFRLDLDYVEFDGPTETRYTQGVTGTWEEEGDAIWLDYVDPITGDWVSLAAFRHHDDLEMTIEGAITGLTIRTSFRR